MVKNKKLIFLLRINVEDVTDMEQNQAHLQMVTGGSIQQQILYLTIAVILHIPGTITKPVKTREL